MFGYPLVNVLGACLIITSMMVVLARTGRAAAFLYSLQSLVLVGVLASLGAVTGSTELFTWSATAFATKVVLVPAILLFTLKKIGDDAEADLPPKLNPMKSVALVAVEVFVCFVAVSGIDLPTAAAVKPTLAVSLSFTEKERRSQYTTPSFRSPMTMGTLVPVVGTVSLS